MNMADFLLGMIAGAALMLAWSMWSHTLSS